MYSLESFLKICQQELRLLQIPIEDAVIRENKRLKSRWGRCSFSIPDRALLIEINPVLLDEQNPVSALKETIIHELLHTCPGCMNHGERWKYYADRVNAAYGYHIKATNSKEEKGIKDNRMISGKVYQLRCLRCGTTIYKYRMCKVVKNPSAFVCSKCGGNIIPINF